MLAGLPGWCYSSPGKGWPVSVYWVEWPSQIWPDHLDVIWREVVWPSDRCSMLSKMVVSAHISCLVCWWEWDRTELDANVLSIRTGWDPSSLRYHWGGLWSALRQRGCLAGRTDQQATISIASWVVNIEKIKGPSIDPCGFPVERKGGLDSFPCCAALKDPCEPWALWSRIQTRWV